VRSSGRLRLRIDEVNDDALNHVGNQGRAEGAAHFSRLEGATFTKNKIFFSSTQGRARPRRGPTR
jgi:hypothetical protein